MKTKLSLLVISFFLVGKMLAQTVEVKADGDKVSMVGKVLPVIEILKNEKLVTNNQNYKIVKFEIATKVEGFDRMERSNSENFTSGMRDLISTLTPGKKIYFDNIQALTIINSDTIIVNVPSISVGIQ